MKLTIYFHFGLGGQRVTLSQEGTTSSTTSWLAHSGKSACGRPQLPPIHRVGSPLPLCHVTLSLTLGLPEGQATVFLARILQQYTLSSSPRHSCLYNWGVCAFKNKRPWLHFPQSQIPQSAQVLLSLPSPSKSWAPPSAY